MSTQIGVHRPRPTPAHHVPRTGWAHLGWPRVFVALWRWVVTEPPPGARRPTPRHESYAVGLGLAPAPDVQVRRLR